MKKFSGFAVDTNILFYAIDKESEKHQEALDFLKRENKKDAAIPLRALSECYSLALNRNKVESDGAAEFLHDLKHDPNFETISPDKKALNKSLGVKKDFWDKLIEQTALQNDYEVIYTENTSEFEEIKEIPLFE